MNIIKVNDKDAKVTDNGVNYNDVDLHLTFLKDRFTIDDFVTQFSKGDSDVVMYMDDGKTVAAKYPGYSVLEAVQEIFTTDPHTISVTLSKPSLNAAVATNTSDITNIEVALADIYEQQTKKTTDTASTEVTQ